MAGGDYLRTDKQTTYDEDSEFIVALYDSSWDFAGMNAYACEHRVTAVAPR